MGIKTVWQSIKKAQGVSQVELMICLVIISVFFLALVAGFGPLATGLFVNKGRTLATNIAQEKIEKLKAVSYYRMLVTPSPQTYPDPAVPYDDTYYPPEVVVAGDISFTRLTYVQKAQEISGDIQPVLPTATDTGLKLITVTVVWGSGTAKRYAQLKNVASNPDMVASDAAFTGTVTDQTTGLAVENANVTIAENSGWLSTTGTDGKYSLKVLAGSYNIVASAQGYFNQMVMQTVCNLGSVTQDFQLVQMDSETVSGYVWCNDHLVISQVVGSSVCASCGFDQEYIELFNPTTCPINIASYGVPVVELLYQSENDSTPQTLTLNYTNQVVPATSYYLIANTTTIHVAGLTLTPDAVFSTMNFGYPDIIKTPDAGGVALRDTSGIIYFDKFGWDRNSGSKTAPIYETEGLDQNIGLQVGEQYVRKSSHLGVTSGYGNCYDSGNNDRDFIGVGVTATFYEPHTSASSATIISGSPVAGAVITMDDGLSSGASTYLTGTIPVAQFDLHSVATGTWNAAICGNGYIEEMSNIVVAGTGNVFIPNASTIPSWSVSGYYNVFLTTTAQYGFITGKVTDVTGNVITTPSLIEVSNGFDSQQTDGNGYYALTCSPGTFSITANNGQANSLYVTQTQSNITVNLGQITNGIDFVLSQGGRITGFATNDGTNPLPGILFIAENSAGASADEEVSGSDGKFTLNNLSTGTYNVYPVLDSGETSSPTTANPTITTPGSTVFSSTYTISGAFGYLSGKVKESGQLINTGVLVVVTAQNLTGTPPAIPSISTATLSGDALYFGSSNEVGSYSVEVRGSTSTYKVYAYYPKVSGSAVEVKYFSGSGYSVTAGSTTALDITSWLP